MHHMFMVLGNGMAWYNTDKGYILLDKDPDDPNIEPLSMEEKDILYSTYNKISEFDKLPKIFTPKSKRGAWYIDGIDEIPYEAQKCDILYKIVHNTPLFNHEEKDLYYVFSGRLNDTLYDQIYPNFRDSHSKIYEVDPMTIAGDWKMAIVEHLEWLKVIFQGLTISRVKNEHLFPETCAYYEKHVMAKHVLWIDKTLLRLGHLKQEGGEIWSVDLNKLLKIKK